MYLATLCIKLEVNIRINNPRPYVNQSILITTYIDFGYAVMHLLIKIYKLTIHTHSNHTHTQ